MPESILSENKESYLSINQKNPQRVYRMPQLFWDNLKLYTYIASVYSTNSTVCFHPKASLWPLEILGHQARLQWSGQTLAMLWPFLKSQTDGIVSALARYGSKIGTQKPQLIETDPTSEWKSKPHRVVELHKAVVAGCSNSCPSANAAAFDHICRPLKNVSPSQTSFEMTPKKHLWHRSRPLGTTKLPCDLHGSFKLMPNLLIIHTGVVELLLLILESFEGFESSSHWTFERCRCLDPLVWTFLKRILSCCVIIQNQCEISGLASGASCLLQWSIELCLVCICSFGIGTTNVLNLAAVIVRLLAYSKAT